MKLKMIGVYGVDNYNTWFQNVGDGCFNFVNDKKLATELTLKEAQEILAHKEWYCKLYGASEMRAVFEV